MGNNVRLDDSFRPRRALVDREKPRPTTARPMVAVRSVCVVMRLRAGIILRAIEMKE